MKKKISNIFKLTFLFCMFLFLAYILLNQIYWHIVSKSWVEHVGKVTKIKTYSKRAEINYRYTYKGKIYTGNKLAFLSEGTIPDKHYITNNYFPEQVITLYLDPISPENSVILKRKFKIQYILWSFVFVALVFLAFLYNLLKIYAEIKKPG